MPEHGHESLTGIETRRSRLESVPSVYSSRYVCLENISATKACSGHDKLKKSDISLVEIAVVWRDQPMTVTINKARKAFLRV